MKMNVDNPNALEEEVSKKEKVLFYATLVGFIGALLALTM